MLDGKEQLVLLKNVSNLPEQQEQVEINDNEVIDCEAMRSDEASNMGNISQKTSDSKIDNTIIEELLIEEVRKGPPIYDYTLSLAACGRRKIADLWEEISKALDGLMSPEDAKKRWKSLKDTFSTYS